MNGEKKKCEQWMARKQLKANNEWKEELKGKERKM